MVDLAANISLPLRDERSAHRNRRASFAAEPSRCSNCETERFRVHAKGLCRRCYDVRFKISQIERWNPADADTLDGYPRGFPLLSDESIRNMQADAIDQLKAHLKELRLREKALNEPVDSIAIEFQLRRLAERAGVRNANITHGLAIVFDGFEPRQRSALFQVLNSMEENIRWHGVRWSRYLNK